MRPRWRLRGAMLTILLLALVLTVAVQAVRLRRAEAQIQRLRAEADQLRYMAAVTRAEAQLREARAHEAVQRLPSSAAVEEGKPAEEPDGGAGEAAP